MIFIGIDPGMSGAVAVINRNREVLLLEDCPINNDAQKMKYILTLAKAFCKDTRVALEDIVAFKMGRTSALNYGKNWGIWRGIIAEKGLILEIPTPQKWQKGLFKKTDGKDKARSLKVARRLFPDAKLHLKKHHGRADALLIADWLRRQ